MIDGILKDDWCVVCCSVWCRLSGKLMLIMFVLFWLVSYLPFIVVGVFVFGVVDAFLVGNMLVRASAYVLDLIISS
jgi:hypothetical protein